MDGDGQAEEGADPQDEAARHAELERVCLEQRLQMLNELPQNNN